MIRYLKVNKETSDRILNGLVGLDSAVETLDIRTSLSLSTLLSSPRLTYSFFTKFGVTQPLPTAETEYAIMFRGGFAIPLKVLGYDAEKRELDILTCGVKYGYHDKIDVEKNHLYTFLQMDKGLSEPQLKHVDIEIDPKDPTPEASVERLIAQFPNKQLFEISIAN